MMDEALAKSGEWPNVAIPAGSDPAEVMERYGVKPSMRDLWSFTELVKKARVEKEERHG